MNSKISSQWLLVIFMLLSVNVYAEKIQLNSSDGQKTMLELFTSEGCSSCPPAERWVNQFEHDKRLWVEVIPLAFHVDYWDYLGWNDPYASQRNSTRQRQYYSEGGISSVYTPGFVKNGSEWRRWFGLKKLNPSAKTPGTLKVAVENNQLTADFMSKDYRGTPLKLNVAILGFGLTTKIKAGENAGKLAKHNFVVLGQSEHHAEGNHWQVDLPKVQSHKASRYAIAVWLTEGVRQRPVQAVGGWLN